MDNIVRNKGFRLLALLGLCTLIVTFIRVIYIHKHPQQAMNYSYSINPSNSACPEHYLNHVDLLMTSTWEHIEEHAGISLTDCQEFLEEYGHEIKESIDRSIRRSAKKFPKISPETLSIIHSIMNDCQLSPAAITITPFNGNGSPAAADDYTLYIDEEDFKSYCAQTQKFLIAHEICHMKSKDHSIESAIVSLIETKTKAERKALSSFAHSTEFRADIYAMLKGAEYARGGITFFQNLIDRYGDGKSITHPRPSERLKIAQEMEAMHIQLEQQTYPIGAVAA